ncbi:hypothetical protein GCM10010492_55740 [Saccharothrix mutabilis subsp. mutabilis]|uniref:NACHT domain-containing protein n=1 Tax=Saccharothrix mutabilis subsp. mutabilis TaxID=66855 RepID=A0ABN0UFA0_9PSEU
MANGGDEGDGARTAQTGVASDAGIVVQAGGDVTFVHNGSFRPGAGPARGPSAPGGPRSTRPMYLRQVDRIAAPRLLDRERELAELEDFCLREDRGPYVWWQAGPWAGKSALLAAFVSDPPESLAGRVWLVSFFVTARLAAQDTSDAFTTAVTAQLCELLGEEPALGVDESVRELLMLDLLSRAAATCRAAGGRLVLVVDGLDEDRGVTTGPHAHSIAALLPGRPEHGMRVVVAGRPNPPIPDDVPDWHPLRDAAVVRPLSGSPHARDRQRLGQSELKRLLRGGPVEQDVLGLLTAARGGLSRSDLRVLTGAGLVEVEDVLHTVAGRTFTRRPGIAGPEVYLLGHEELHTAACDYLGPERLAAYRARLFAWADGYLAPGAGRAAWPPETPEYLVTGYPRMLATIGDAARLTALATDRVRHDRMLDVSGGDAAALVEITTCQDLLLAAPGADLLALARLSVHRHELQTRNSHIPTELPAVWAVLGHTARAEALARGVTDPHHQELALELLADAVAATGDAGHAEQIVRGLPDVSQRARALARVAARLGATGHARSLAGKADVLLRTITRWHEHTATLIVLAGTWAALGEHDHAVRLARAIHDDHERARVLTTLARAAAVAGDRRGARRLAADAEQIAHRTTDDELRATLLAGLVGVAVRTGDHERAHDLVAEVDRIAGRITDPRDRSWALVGLVEALTAIGDHDRARSVARAIPRPGDGVRALRLVARDSAHPAAPHPAHDAERLARTITDPLDRARALTALARDAADTDPGSARRLATEAEQLARAITNRYRHTRTLTALAGALAAIGEHERANRTAHRITDPTDRGRALLDLTRSAVAADVPGVAHRLVEEAEQLAREITDPQDRDRHLVELAKAAWSAGLPERASRIADAVADRAARTEVLSTLASLMSASGDHARAARVARGIPRPDDRARAWVELALARVRAGDPPAARRLAEDAAATAREGSDVAQKAHVLARLLEALTTKERYRASRLSDVAAEIAAEGFTPTRARTTAEFIEALSATADERSAHRLTVRVARLAGTIQHTTSLEHIAHAFAVVGAEEELRTVVDRLAARNGWTSAWTEVVEALITSGHPERAVRIAFDMSRDHVQAVTLSRLAESLADRNEHALAGQVAIKAARKARYTLDPDVRAAVLAELSDTLVAAGDHERARRFVTEAARITPRHYGRAAGLARTFAAAGDLEQARLLATEAARLIRSTGDPDGQAAALAGLARTFATAGDLEQARLLAEEAARIVHRATRPDRKAKALTALAVVADLYGVERFLGEALVTGAWPTILPVLARLDPRVVVEIADELERSDTG